MTDEQSVCLSVQLPVDGSRRIATRVPAVFLELNAGSAMFGSVSASRQTIDDAAGKQLQVLQFGVVDVRSHFDSKIAGCRRFF